MTTHDLKVWPSGYDAIVRGDKTFEVRSELDRDFAVGDVLHLFKWDPLRMGNWFYKDGSNEFLSDRISARYLVTYILHGGRFGLPPGMCVMSIVPAPDEL